LKTKDGKSVVLVLEDEQQIEKEVKTGVTNGKQIEVTSGLNEGEIVLSVQLQLQDKNKGSSPFSPARSTKPKK
jgi:macrolide-specific efflux system membrane fusion protein